MYLLETSIEKGDKPVIGVHHDAKRGAELLEPDSPSLHSFFPLFFLYIQFKHIQWLPGALLSATARQNGRLMADTLVSPIYH